MVDAKKTHREIEKPSLNVRYLADYMAASEQTKRTVLRGCKYRSTARLIQHIEAKLVVAEYIRAGIHNPQELLERSNKILSKLPADQFEEDTNKHNASYINRFAEAQSMMSLPSAEIQQQPKPVDIDINGVRVRFDPALALTRTTKTNKVKCGALMLRYQKGKALPAQTAAFQCAAALGILKLNHGDDGIEPEGALCLTLDAYTGMVHSAPSNAGYLFKEMQAACLSIAERWTSVTPPTGAVF